MLISLARLIEADKHSLSKMVAKVLSGFMPIGEVGERR